MRLRLQVGWAGAALALLPLMGACREAPMMTADDSCIAPFSLMAERPSIMVGDSTRVLAHIDTCTRFRAVVRWSVEPAGAATVQARDTLQAIVIGRAPGTVAVTGWRGDGDFVSVGIIVVPAAVPDRSP